MKQKKCDFFRGSFYQDWTKKGQIKCQMDYIIYEWPKLLLHFKYAFNEQNKSLANNRIFFLSTFTDHHSMV